MELSETVTIYNKTGDKKTKIISKFYENNNNSKVL